LAALGKQEYMLDAEMSALSQARLNLAQDAVEQTVLEKIRSYLDSAGKAAVA
jgi:fructose-bisphosphate aldolase class II